MADYTIAITPNNLSEKKALLAADTLTITVARGINAVRLSSEGGAAVYRRRDAPDATHGSPISSGALIPVSAPAQVALSGWLIYVDPSANTTFGVEAIDEDLAAPDNSGAAASGAITTHEAAADPHPDYVLEGIQRDVSGATVVQIVSDFQALVQFDTTAAPCAYNLLALDTLDRGKYKWVDVYNGDGANDVTVDGDGADTIRSGGVTAGTLVIPPGDCKRIWVPASGTIWRAP